MSDLKTTPNDDDVEAFLASVEHDRRREDCRAVVEMMRDVTGVEPRMWGPSIIGFDSYHYVYDTGREGDWFITGVSPRKGSLTLYIMPGFERYEGLMERLGKHKTGRSCLYVNTLDDVDPDVLRELVEESVRYMREKYHD